MIPAFWSNLDATGQVIFILLIVVVIVHHLQRNKPFWLWATGIVGSALLAYLLELLGFVSRVENYFGSKWNAIGAYFLAGFVWLWCEIFWDLLFRVRPAYESFRKTWDQATIKRVQSVPAGKQRRQVAYQIVDEWNRKPQCKSPILHPAKYVKSRSRLQSFALWFLFWPFFLGDTLAWCIRHLSWTSVRKVLLRVVQFQAWVVNKVLGEVDPDMPLNSGGDQSREDR